MKIFKKLLLVSTASLFMLTGCTAGYDKSFYETEYNTARMYKMCYDCVYALVNMGDGIIEYDMSNLTAAVIKYDTALFREGIYFAAIPSGFIAIDSSCGMTGISTMTDTEQYLDLTYLNLKGEAVDTVHMNKVGIEPDNSQIYDRYVDNFSSFAVYKGYIYGNVNDRENETHITRYDPLKNERQVLLANEKGLFSLAGIADDKIYLIKAGVDSAECEMITLSAGELKEQGRIKLSGMPLRVEVYSGDTAVICTAEETTVYKEGELLNGGILKTGECISCAGGNYYYVYDSRLYKTDDINSLGTPVAEDVSYAENIYGKYIILNVDYSTPSSYLDEPIRFYDIAAAILRKEPLTADGSEGINGLTLSNAMHLSDWTGKPVTLPLDEELFYSELEKRVKTSRRKENVSAVIADTSGSYNTEDYQKSHSTQW